MDTQYWLAYSVASNVTTVHLVDDIDCMPPDVYGPIRRYQEVRHAADAMLEYARKLRFDSLSRRRVHVSANVKDGLFETRKTIKQWVKAKLKANEEFAIACESDAAAIAQGWDLGQNDDLSYCETCKAWVDAEGKVNAQGMYNVCPNCANTLKD